MTREFLLVDYAGMNRKNSDAIKEFIQNALWQLEI